VARTTFTESEVDDDKALQHAFSEPYIDANQFVPQIVANITSDVNDYHTNPGDYNAPYTSVVTSSLMGKSRLLKEMARYQPSVYICLRPKDASGYPKRSDVIADYLLEAASSSLPNKGYRNQIKYDYNALSTAKYALFLLHLIVGLKTLIKSPPKTLTHRHPSFFWEYFAETPTELTTHLKTFWNEIKTEVQKELAKLGTRDGLTNFSETSDIGGRLNDAFEEFREEYLRLGYSANSNFSILLFFDEARHLCQTTAFNGCKIYTIREFTALTKVERQKLVNGYVEDGFSCFLALRRAIRKTKEHGETYAGARLFGLFTDTTSRLGNFQPQKQDDHSFRTLRNVERDFGELQFSPIHCFTSIDAAARSFEITFPDRNTVATPARLTKFGRIGWYSLCQGGITQHLPVSLPIFAACKLVNVLHKALFAQLWASDASLPNVSLRLLTPLASRLSLRLGPDRVEASELVSSHLGVLIREEGAHYLEVIYPSEPVVAEGSAILLYLMGWGKSLQALNSYLLTGIVPAGFRGELITKILCLMAQDNAQICIRYNRLTEWRFSRCLPVRDFLNQFISSPDSAILFCEWVLQQELRTDPGKLGNFLKGTIFFSHFVRASQHIRIQDVAVAWCRGYALMCAPGNPAYDHLIPVLMPNADVSKFGPVFGEWTGDQIAAARKSFSYILIDSKLYSTCPNWTTVAHALRPRDVGKDGKPTKETNLIGCKPLENVYLSVVQNFGDLSSGQTRVDVHNRKPERQSPRGTTTTNDAESLHFSIVLNGLSRETYACLSPLQTPDSERLKELPVVREALENMRYLSVPYVDPNGNRTKQPCFAVESMSFAFAGKEKEFAGLDFFKNWEKEGERIRSLKSGQSNEEEMKIDNEDMQDDQPEEEEDPYNDDESRMDFTE